MERFLDKSFKPEERCANPNCRRLLSSGKIEIAKGDKTESYCMECGRAKLQGRRLPSKDDRQHGEKPKDAVCWGKCPTCGEEGWLYKWEGTYDDPKCLWCEGCIDEAHDRMREAEDAMADPSLVEGEDVEPWEEPEIEDCGEEEYY